MTAQRFLNGIKPCRILTWLTQPRAIVQMSTVQFKASLPTTTLQRQTQNSRLAASVQPLTLKTMSATKQFLPQVQRATTWLFAQIRPTKTLAVHKLVVCCPTSAG